MLITQELPTFKEVFKSEVFIISHKLVHRLYTHS
jgi:hypothetical protein